MARTPRLRPIHDEAGLAITVTGTPRRTRLRASVSPPSCGSRISAAGSSAVAPTQLPQAPAHQDPARVSPARRGRALQPPARLDQQAEGGPPPGRAGVQREVAQRARPGGPVGLV